MDDNHDWQINPRPDFIHHPNLGSKIAWIAERLVLETAMARLSHYYIAMTAGNFDPLHWGHIDGFYQGLIPEYTDDLPSACALFVCVDSDQDVMQQKGPDRPVWPLTGRISMLAAVEGVTCVIPFQGGRTDQIIEIVKPDWFFKGDDRSWEDTPEREVLTRLDIPMHRVQRRIEVQSSQLAVQ